jgi:hypothetical protein
MLGSTVTGQARLVSVAAQLLAMLFSHGRAEGWVLHAHPLHSVQTVLSRTVGVRHLVTPQVNTLGCRPKDPICAAAANPMASITNR